MNPTGNELLVWIGCAAFLVGFINQTLKLLDRAKGKPSPAEVEREAAAKFVVKTEFERHVIQNEQDRAQLFSKIGGVERGAMNSMERKLEELRVERREDAADLHEKINEVGKKVAGLETATTMQNQLLAEIRADQKRRG